VKSELGWPEETKIVTFVGRLVHAKGVDWLLDIWKVVAPQDRLARLLIVGDGPERAALEDQLRSLGIAQTATFIGRQDNVYKFLAITDVFVLPSRQEGNSNALLEAMSQALPAVVADDLLSGNREIVDHGRDGYVIKLGDSAAFAHALLKLLTEPQLRREMGRNARRKVQEKFSMRLVADRYCRIYSELTQDSAS
jgi:glycosyltransferase involved in cell wall biosynthesis